MQAESTESASKPAAEAVTGAVSDLATILWDWAPFMVWFAIVAAGLLLADRVLLKKDGLKQSQLLPRIMTMVTLSIAGLVIVIVAMPTREGGILTDAIKGNLITLIGLSLTAIITLSSTTIAANAMAGLMLRGVGSFRIGDFVRVGEYFGRITERGLFHVEIQTEDRDLVTLPNMFISTNPVRVVRSSGTVVSAEVGLGYDVPHGRITELLKKAAEEAGLTDPFVWILELQDHAVKYRVNGMLEEVKTLVSARSKLHASVLDTLHGAGVEIVSPGFTFHRNTDLSQKVVPKREKKKADDDNGDPESKVFDKAESAEQLDEMHDELETLRKKIKEVEKSGEDGSETECERMRQQAADLEAKIKSATGEAEDEGAAADKPGG